MRRLIRSVAGFVFVTVASILAIVLYKRHGWVAEMEAQCAAAAPLVARRAAASELPAHLGRASEYLYSDAALLDRHFGTETEKRLNLRANLSRNGRVRVYSQSNSIMFVYLAADARVVHAACFLQ